MRAALAALLVLASCAAPETTRRATPELSLPPMKTFSVTPAQPSRLSNSQIARDFLDLTFELENGDALPVFTRLEGEITLRVLGEAADTLEKDLGDLIARLEIEAGITITRVDATSPASITIAPMTRRQIQSAAPGAACFVRANVSDWETYRKERNNPATFWNRLAERREVTVFLPKDVSPQEIRDCLHEEIAQGLGPVNDLYRLSESVFNDDNFHTVLTGYDMLMLAITYDPALQTGMTRQQVALVLPSILRRLNQRGGNAEIAPPARQMAAWDRVVSVATAQSGQTSRKIKAAEDAVRIAAGSGFQDARLAFSYYVLGRLSLGQDPVRALKAFQNANALYASLPNSELQQAHVALQLSAFALSSENVDEALALANRHIPTARRAEHAALLSLLMLVRAEALDLQGQKDQATIQRQEALAWGRYGFGRSDKVRARAAEILALSPRSRRTEETGS